MDSRCLLLFNSFEEIGFCRSRAGHDAGSKMKELRISELCDVCVEGRKHRRLSSVRMKCGDLRFQVSPNFDARGERWQGDRLAVWQRSGRGRIVKLVYAVGKQTGAQLIGKTVVASCPVKGQSCEDRRHRMVGVAGNHALRPHGEHDLRAKFTDVQH